MYGIFDDETLGSLPQNLADQARAFLSAAKAIDSGAGAATGSGGETGDVADWAKRQGKLISDEALAALPIVSFDRDFAKFPGVKRHEPRQ
jgi:hypothetical protein